jgi:hypothetical protein
VTTPPALFDPSSVNSSLLRFARLGLGLDKINVEEHGVILNELESLTFKIPQTIDLILLPRASYKTSIASVSFPMYCLSRDPNLRILIDSETYGLAKNILSEIKEHYTSQTSPLYQLATPYSFSHLKERDFVRWSESEIIIPTRSIPKKEASITASGIDGIKAGMHYDIIIADDLHSQNNTKNQSQIDQVVEHVKLLLSLLEPNGILIVIGTRWALEDAYTQIEKEATRTLFIPASSTEPMNARFDPTPVQTESDNPQLVYDVHSKEATEAKLFYLNFPKTLPWEHLQRIEKRQGPYIYSAQYILKPVSARQKRFQDAWLHAVPQNYRPGPGHRIIGLVDPAFTTQDYSDFSGIVIGSSDEKRKFSILYAEEHKVEPFDLIDLLFSLSETFSVRQWFIEEVAAQKVLRFFLEYLAAKQKKRLVFSPVKSYGRKKEIRIQSLQPWFAANLIDMPSNPESPLWAQIRNFPLIKKDDVLDALAYLPQVLYDGCAAAPLVPVPHKGIRFDDLLVAQQQPEGIRPKGWESPAATKFYTI